MSSNTQWNGPHAPLPVEAIWREFVRSVGGEVVEDWLPEPRTFANADFLFREAGIVAELKEIETEFSASKAFERAFEAMMERLLREDPEWKPPAYGGSGSFPTWFGQEYLRIFRPPISRTLRKANKQIRETKNHLALDKPSGILILVNDSFITLEPHFVYMIAADLLSSSYSSIDCLLYLTVNRYVEVEGSDLANLLWLTAYSDRAEDSLADFVDQLGRQWFDFLQTKIGPFTDHSIIPHSKDSAQMRTNAILVPGDELVLPFSKRSLKV